MKTYTAFWKPEDETNFGAFEHRYCSAPCSTKDEALESLNDRLDELGFDSEDYPVMHITVACLDITVNEEA